MMMFNLDGQRRSEVKEFDLVLICPPSLPRSKGVEYFVWAVTTYIQSRHVPFTTIYEFIAGDRI